MANEIVKMGWIFIYNILKLIATGTSDNDNTVIFIIFNFWIKNIIKLNKILLIGKLIYIRTMAMAHGYVDTPASRAFLYRSINGACGSVQWEPQSVEGPSGFSGTGPADGQLPALAVRVSLLSTSKHLHAGVKFRLKQVQTNFAEH